MRGSKAKMIRRIYWTEEANGRKQSLRRIKKIWGKGIPFGLTVTYPRCGRDWKGLVK